MKEKSLGKYHPDTRWTAHAIASLLWDQGKKHEAHEWHARSVVKDYRYFFQQAWNIVSDFPVYWTLIFLYLISDDTLPIPVLLLLLFVYYFFPHLYMYR